MKIRYNTQIPASNIEIHLDKIHRNHRKHLSWERLEKCENLVNIIRADFVAIAKLTH